ncbi:MAG: hypothetical protein AAGJ29_06065 [Pseudomonadota bacterium]
MTAVQMMLVLIGVFIGSGAAFRKVGPYVFFYLAFPVLSALGFVFFMQSFPIPGLVLDFSGHLPSVFRTQANLAAYPVGGVVFGAVAAWIQRRLFLKSDRRILKRLPLIDPEISMERKKHLIVLGLKNDAGPQDVIKAWRTKVSEVSAKRRPWQKRANTSDDITPEERKRRLDEAYHWLMANPRKAA